MAHGFRKFRRAERLLRQPVVLEKARVPRRTTVPRLYDSFRKQEAGDLRRISLQQSVNLTSMTAPGFEQTATKAA